MDTCSVDASVIVSAIALLFSFISAVFVYFQIRFSLRQSRIEFLLKFDDTFSNKEFREARATAAKTLIKHRAGKKIDISYVDDVLDFFEGIGLLVRERALIEKFVWHYFSYWLRRYFILCKTYIETIQQRPDERSRWKDLAWLHSRLLLIEKKENQYSDADLVLSENDLDSFLKDESTLIE